MDKLFVIKESNTFSETIEVLGLAYIIDAIFQKTMPHDKPKILIQDQKSHYQIAMSKKLTQDMIDGCNYFDFFRYIGKKSNDENIKKYNGIDYAEEKAIRNKYNKLKKDEKENAKQKTHFYYDIIRMCANMNAYNKSFLNCRLFEENFPFFLNLIFNFYSSPGIDKEKYRDLKRVLDSKEIRPAKINSLQDINPDKGKGANKDKASGIKPSGQSNFWLQQLIRFTGVWQSFISGYIKKDFKNYSLVPNNISFEYLKTVYDKFRPFVKGGSSIKLDIILIIFLVQKLIEHHKDYNEEWSDESVSNKISGFQFAYYKNLGQRPAVTNIGFLGLPNFIKFKSEEEGRLWLDVLVEHGNIICSDSIKESYSSNISMLQKYRQFISTGDFNAFLDFQFEYSTFLISSRLKKEYFINTFSIKNMEVLMGTTETYQKIISNPGFQAIASAIRNSTIVPVIHQNNKDAIFGLSQKFKIASKDKDTFTSEVSQFIQLYNEKIMLKDYNKKPHQKYVTTEELTEFYKLLDKDYSAKLISGMLIAFGFAKEPSKE